VIAGEIVEWMSEWVADEGATLERRDGVPAADVAREVQAALMSAMEVKLSYVVLWEQFLSTPDEVASALVSVVQALMEADPVLASWLEQSLARYRQAAGGERWARGGR
jgi:hypothetical protein